ncbi:MAG: TolC family protein, partial [Gammaproteobacteria bacterium]|nr:TolC family protein [Gammaproteobacteria bacterium]
DISQVKALKQVLASSSIALEATQAGFDVGTRTAIDVLDSQRELYRARRDYAQVRYNYVLETLRLKLAAGILSAQDIEQLNPWLQ